MSTNPALAAATTALAAAQPLLHPSRHHSPGPLPAAASHLSPQHLPPSPWPRPPPRLHHVLLPASTAACEGAAAAGEGASTAAAPILDPSRLISALEKLARVGAAPEPAWLDMYLAVTEPVLPTLAAGELASLARSLGRLGVEVPERWARALLEASEAALTSAERPADVAEMIVWVANDGRLAAGPAWVGAALRQIQLLIALDPRPSSPASDLRGVVFRDGGASLSPALAADVAWAVARMGYRPADSLLDCLAAVTLTRTLNHARAPQPAPPTLDRNEQWEPTPGRREQQQAYDTPAPAAPLELSELPPEQLARLAWAFASYNYFPPDEWVQAYWLQGIWRRGLSPEGATAVLWSLGCMQLPLEEMWVRNYCLLTAGRLNEIPLEGLINAVWAIAACREVARAAAKAPAAAAVESQGDTGNPVPEAEAEATAAAKEGKEDEQRLRARLEEYAAGAVMLEQHLQALLRLRDGGGGATPAQQETLSRLQEALDRRLAQRAAAADSGGSGGEPPPVPAAWAAEWYHATLPYLEDEQQLPYIDRTLLVKALWAAATLELTPPARWTCRLAAAATAVLAAGSLEPLELLYASRAADALLSQRRRCRRLRRQLPPLEKSRNGDGENEEEEEACEALGRFAAESFVALSRQQQLPPNWRRLNPRFPPYAQPKPGAVDGAAAAPGDERGAAAAVNAGGSSTSMVATTEREGAAPGGGGGGLMRRPVGRPVVPGAGLLRPFR